MLCQVWEARSGRKGQAARVPVGPNWLRQVHKLPDVAVDAKLGRMNSALSQHSVILVISPLDSLIVNQVNKLRSVGVSAAILSGKKGVDKRLQAVTQIQVLPYLQLSQARSTTAATMYHAGTHSVVYLRACRNLDL